jgi:RNA polymerase sigma-70 factor (ECF subfamily)
VHAALLHLEADVSPADDRKAERDRAFRAAAEALAPVAWRVLRRSGVGEADVDDAMQRLLVQIARHWERLGALPPGELRGYACCAAVGVARTIAREEAARKAKIDRAAPEAKGEGAPRPDEALSRMQSARVVDRILASMDEERRAVFILYELEGLSGPEIAAHLGVPLGTVASRLRKAREDFEQAVARFRATEHRMMGGAR